MKDALRNWIESVRMKWILAGGLGYLLALFAGISFLVGPEFERYREAVDKQVGLDDTYINLISLDIERAIRETESSVDALRKLESGFQSRLLGEKSLISLLPVIDRYCRQSRLKVARLEPLEETVDLGNGYQKHLVRANLLGKYADFLTLLKKLEAHPQWILIESMTVTALEEGSVGRFNTVLALVQETSKT